ncbi:unnamed protein product [Ectocarpus fasciculatus]
MAGCHLRAPSHRGLPCHRPASSTQCDPSATTEPLPQGVLCRLKYGCAYGGTSEGVLLARAAWLRLLFNKVIPPHLFFMLNESSAASNSEVVPMGAQRASGTSAVVRGMHGGLNGAPGASAD